MRHRKSVAIIRLYRRVEPRRRDTRLGPVRCAAPQCAPRAALQSASHQGQPHLPCPALAWPGLTLDDLKKDRRQTVHYAPKIYSITIGLLYLILQDARERFLQRRHLD